MVTIFILGYAAGVLLLGPLSEIYGRRPTTIGSTWMFIVFMLGSGFAPNMPGLIVMRFLAGFGGSGVMAISPALVADLYPLESRAFWTSAIVLSQCLGPVRE